MFKRIAFLVAASLLMIAPVRADYVIKDGAGTMRTIKAGTTCGVDVICSQTSLLDGTGAYIGTGANPFAITFGTGVTLPAFATTPTFNLGNINGAAPSANNPLWVQPGTGAVFHVECDAGCSGGGGGGTSSLFGAAFPSSGTAIGLSDGTNMVSLRGDETNGAWVNLKASVPIAVTGTFWQATQPVSGTVAATQSGTWNIGSVTSLPAITGAVTANAGTNLNTSALALESGGNLATAATGITTINTNIGSPGATVCATDTASCNLNALLQRNNARISSMITALGSPFQAGGSIGNTAFGISGTLPAFAATPTFNLGTLNGAATAAAQTTGNASLSSIDGKTPALGQALAAASVPVILPAATITTLTPPTTVTANLGTIAGVATATNQTGGGQKTQIVDGSGNVIASTSNNLNVQCANCSGSGVSTADGASFTAGASLFAGAGGVYQTSATTNPLTNGQQGLFQVTANRALFTNLRNTAGAEVGTSGIPLQVSLANTAANATAVKTDGSAVTQPISGTVTSNVGSGTRAVSIASGQVASGALASGSIAAGAQVDLLTMRGTKNAGTAAANSILSGGVYNSTPLTLTDGQQSSFQFDANGFLKISTPVGLAQGSTTSGQTGSMIMGAVTTSAPTYTTAQTSPISLDTSGNMRITCANCSGSGATGTDQGAFTAGSSTFAPGGGFYQTTATSNPLTNGQWGTWQMTANRAGFINLRNASGTEVGTSSAEVFVGGRGTAGSAAGGVLTVQGVASMTPLFVQSGTAPVSTMNSASANSGLSAANAAVFDDVSPTAITENSFGYLRMSANRNLYGTIRDAAGNERGANVDASNRLTTAPSLVSGSVASGAVASGAFASGSIASGAIAAGAQVDLLTMRGTKNAGTAAANSLLAGGVYNSTPLTLTDTQQSSLQLNASGNLRVDNVSVAGTTILTGNGATGSGSQRVTIANDSSAIAGKGEGATGSAAPTGAQQMGVRSGANMVAATQANASVAISGNSAATAQLVALSASAVIHVTSFDFMSAGTANVTLVYGTGTNCGTGTTSLTGAYPLTAQAGIAKGSGQGPVLVVPAGNALCWTNSAGVQVSGSLSYTQFVP